MLAAVTPKTRLIFVPNPNNPTGTLLSQGAIDDFMSRISENVIAVFDEAYFEFLDRPPDTLRFVREGRTSLFCARFRKFMDWPACASAMPLGRLIWSRCSTRQGNRLT